MSISLSNIGPTAQADLERLLALLEQEADCLADRRDERRHPTQSPATLELIADDGQRHVVQRVWVTDVSRAGVGLILEQPLGAKARLLLNLSALAQTPCLLPIQVIYCRKLMTTTHRVGAAFCITGN